MEPRSHAIVNRQRLARAVIDQTIVRIGQDAVVIETGDSSAREDRGEARMLAYGEASAQCFACESFGGDGPQVIVIQLQQCDGIAAEMGAQGADKALQADGLREVSDEIGQQQLLKHGYFYRIGVYMTISNKGFIHPQLYNALFLKGFISGMHFA